MSRQLLEKSDKSRPPSANEIVFGILEEVGDISTLMEVFYFSREPDCLAVLRWLAALPDGERRTLGDFARAVREGDAMRVERPDPISLRLTLIQE